MPTTDAQCADTERQLTPMSAPKDAPAALLVAVDRFLAKLELGDMPSVDFGLDSPCLDFTGFRNSTATGTSR
jgi:hypothetical protein